MSESTFQNDRSKTQQTRRKPLLRDGKCLNQFARNWISSYSKRSGGSKKSLLSPSNERTLTSCDSPSTFYLGLDKNRTEEPPCSRLATSGGLRNEEFRSTSGDDPDVASSRLSESRSTSPNREGRRTSLAQPPEKRPRNRASVLQEDQWAIGGQSLSAAFRSTGAISGQQHT